MAERLALAVIPGEGWGATGDPGVSPLALNLRFTPCALRDTCARHGSLAAEQAGFGYWRQGQRAGSTVVPSSPRSVLQRARLGGWLSEEGSSP